MSDQSPSRPRAAAVALRGRRAAAAGLAALATTGAALALAGPASAFNYVGDANGTFWGIQDVAAPRVDTGSIRATQAAPNVGGAYTTAINGYGGIRVSVSGSPAPRFNGELMRGFGLTFDGLDHFRTTDAVQLGGVKIARDIQINRANGSGRWFDSFTNTTGAPLTIRVAFGGQTGYGTSGGNSSALVNSSTNDTTVTAADSWAEVATPLNGNTLVGGPQATVIGTPAMDNSPFAGAMTFTGNWLYDTFSEPLVPTGHYGNFQGYVNTLTIPAGRTRSLLHFVVLGQRVTATTSANVRSTVESKAGALATTPDVSRLTTAQVCSIDNFDVTTLPGYDAATCASAGTVGQIVAPQPTPQVTSSPYDVVDKTIGQLRADMESGATTAQRITRAYLDRIAVYDRGQFGFNSYEFVAQDAMAQAKAADARRAAGDKGGLLGIPIGIKNLYDTKDMPTTNGSLTFAGFRPKEDAFQVAKLREAGAVIIGKTALEEYATSGSYSNDPWGQVWNAFQPSRSALASSGGSATATAASFGAAAMGSQTGDSLYAPASGASLVTLRGTDGLESGTGVMPLGYLTDFGGAMTRTVSDLADILNVVTGTDPKDPGTALADQKRPADWRTRLDPNALRGKRIGYIPSTWVDPFGTTNTTSAEWAAAQRYFTAAGATLVEMGATVGDSGNAPSAPPASTPNPNNTLINDEGWNRYIDAHPELAEQGFDIQDATDVACSQRKVAFVRQAPETCAGARSPRLTEAQVQQRRDYRALYAANADTWMDAAGADDRGVDAVVYPGLLSDISLNDGGGNKASFGRMDTPSAAAGIPTLAFPVGANDKGQPINIQLLGRAWSDPELVGYAHAFEELSTAQGQGHLAPATVPALPFEAGAEPQTTTVAQPVESVRTVQVPGPATPATTTKRVLPLSVTATTSPRRATGWPKVLTTTGRVRYPVGLASATACSGRVEVRMKSGAKTVSTRRVSIGRRNGLCLYRSQVTFRRSNRLTARTLTVQVRFVGNDVLLPRTATTRQVTVR